MSAEQIVIVVQQEPDGQWFAEFVGIPAAMGYGASKWEAIAAATKTAEFLATEPSSTVMRTSE